MKIKVGLLFLLILSSCKDKGSLSSDECIVLRGTREFKESDLVKLKAEAPATMTRNGSARLLFDLLRAEHVINGTSEPAASMKDRLLTYETFIKKFPDSDLGSRELDQIKTVKKGPCFQKK